MGSELGHVSMYYTEDEPPIDIIGKKRHFFGKPSIKGMANIKNTQIDLLMVLLQKTKHHREL